MAPPCRFFAAGACAKGAACSFSHDTAVANALAIPCVYYAKGHCSYGDKCRYDHVRAGASLTSTAPAAPAAPAVTPGLPSYALPPATAPAWTGAPSAALVGPDDEYDPDEAEVLAELEALGLTGVGDGADDVSRLVVGLDAGAPDAGPDAGAPVAAPCADLDAAPTPGGLCGAWTATGRCARGDSCRHAHGDACARCGRHALHPTDAAARAAHDAECEAREARIAELAASAGVECGICMEIVLSKPRPGDRRFGLLACDHAFCLTCIRSWRGAASGPDGGRLDVDGAVRACPVCRTKADFVTPSATWPPTRAARDAVVAGYRAALAAIECRHWDRGRGVCPFGSSCHYRHVDADGADVDRAAGLRFVGDAEGAVKPMAAVRLSDFLVGGTSSSAGARRALRR